MDKATSAEGTITLDSALPTQSDWTSIFGEDATIASSDSLNKDVFLKVRLHEDDVDQMLLKIIVRMRRNELLISHLLYDESFQPVTIQSVLCAEIQSNEDLIGCIKRYGFEVIEDALIEAVEDEWDSMTPDERHNDLSRVMPVKITPAKREVAIAA